MKQAFSLIELLVVVGIIGILAATSVVTLSQLSSRSRDSSRRESLGAYATSLEQYKASHGHYVVDSTVSSNLVTGYINQGWGRVTRIGVNSSYSSGVSIADVLQQKGYLTTIQTDPSLRGLAANRDSDTTNPVAKVQTGSFTNDFFLIVCSYKGDKQITAGSGVDSGVEYALYGNLENSAAVSGANTTDRQQCGFNISIGQGASDLGYNTPTPIRLHFNYSVGPSLEGH